MKITRGDNAVKETIKHLEAIILKKSEKLVEETNAEAVTVMAECVRIATILKRNEAQEYLDEVLLQKIIKNIDVAIVQKVKRLDEHTSTAEVTILAELVRVGSILKKNEAMKRLLEID